MNEIEQLRKELRDVRAELAKFPARFANDSPMKPIYCRAVLTEDLADGGTAKANIVGVTPTKEIEVHGVWGEAETDDEIGVLWNYYVHQWEAALQRCPE